MSIFMFILGCQVQDLRPDVLSVPVALTHHQKLQEKWVIDSAPDDPMEFAFKQDWGQARVASEHRFLQHPSWETFETWIVLDSFSPYPPQFTQTEKSEIRPLLSEDAQQVLNGLEALEKNESPEAIQSTTEFGLWYSFRRSKSIQSHEDQLEMAIALHKAVPIHFESCLFLMRDARVYRDFERWGRILKECQISQSSNVSMLRQQADFYDGIGLYKEAHGIYEENELFGHMVIVAAQEGWYSKYEDLPLEHLDIQVLDGVVHRIWLAILFQKEEQIRELLPLIQGKEEPFTWAAAGAGYLSIGEPKAALERLETASGVVVDVLRSRAYISLNQKEKARPLIESALVQMPWNPWIQLVYEDAFPDQRTSLENRDPLSFLITGSFRERQRPWPLIVAKNELFSRIDDPLKVEKLTRLLSFNQSPNPSNLEQYRQSCGINSRACWALFNPEAESDERWEQLVPIEKRYVTIFHDGGGLNEEELKQYWYASGLHRLIVEKTDNLP
jgi:tetratricopeptide (TPR) repeat protein